MKVTPAAASAITLSLPNGLTLPELAERRGRVYRALALAYIKPAGEELLELLRPWGKLPGEFPPGAFPKVLKLGLKGMGDWLRGAGSPASAEALASLETEFTRLFRGLSRRHSPPPPYESVYLEGGLLYGQATRQVRQSYARFQLKGQGSEPPDHIALELDFLGFLCQGEAEAWEREGGAGAYLEEEATFLREHLAPWVPAFCEKIRRSDTTGFYSALSDGTEGWIGCEQRLIGRLIKLGPGGFHPPA